MDMESSEREVLSRREKLKLAGEECKKAVMRIYGWDPEKMPNWAVNADNSVTMWEERESGERCIGYGGGFVWMKALKRSVQEGVRCGNDRLGRLPKLGTTEEIDGVKFATAPSGAEGLINLTVSIGSDHFLEPVMNFLSQAVGEEIQAHVVGETQRRPWEPNKRNQLEEVVEKETGERWWEASLLIAEENKEEPFEFKLLFAGPEGTGLRGENFDDGQVVVYRGVGRPEPVVEF